MSRITEALKKRPILFTFLAVLLLAAISENNQVIPDPGTDTPSQARTINDRSTPTTVTIGQGGSHLISDYWYESGARDAGFTLDAYIKAVEELNPGVDLSPLWDGEKLRFPMGVKAGQ